ncbi:hypothetical protein HOY80DRAFT_700687 [Tuber brumale]|nr:hypothetical protein HOY80DRAFT_700687 [Tuber brumale]
MSYLEVPFCEEEKIVRSFIKHEGVKMRIVRFLQWVTGILLLLEVEKDMPMCYCLSFFHDRFQVPIIICCELVFYTLYAFLCSNAIPETQIIFLRLAYLVDVLLAFQITFVWSLCQDLAPGDPPYICTWKGLLAIQSIMFLLYSAFKSNIGLNLTTREEAKGLLGTECRRHFESRSNFSGRCSGYHPHNSASIRPAHQNGGLTVHFFDPRELDVVDKAEGTILEKLTSIEQTKLLFERYPEIYDEKFEMSFDDVFEHEPYLPPGKPSEKPDCTNQ